MASEIILKNGQTTPYQDMLECVVGEFLARNMPYFDYEEATQEEKRRLHKDDSFFRGDGDYEIIIRKKRSSK